MEDKVVLGIDVSKDKLDAALLRQSKYKTRTFKNDHKGFEELIVWMNKHTVQTVHVCLEATGIYGEGVSHYLFDKGILVSVVNPAKIKGFGRGELSRTKTDKTDSQLIARFCLAMNPIAYKPAAPEIRELRGLVKRVDSLLKMKQEEGNRLGVCAEIIKSSIGKIIEALDEQIEEIREKIKNHIASHPLLKKQKELLETIPGVGLATIAQVLSMECTPERFENVKDLVAFVGLNPKHRQSGSSIHGRSHISKTGDSTLRKALYMPAIVAKQHNPILKALYDRLLAAGKPKMLAICAVMRKLLHLIYGVLKTGKIFDPNYKTPKKEPIMIDGNC